MYIYIYIYAHAYPRKEGRWEQLPPMRRALPDIKGTGMSQHVMVFRWLLNKDTSDNHGCLA